LDHVKGRLEDVSRIAAKYKNETTLKRFLHFGMARSRLDDLKVIEIQMGVVLQLLVAHDTAEIKSILQERRLPLVASNQTISPGIETKRGDQWKNSFSSVPVPPLPSFVETQSIRDLRHALLNSENRSRVVTVHGMGGAGKTTACKVLSNDKQGRQNFHEGIFWIEFGQDSSADAVNGELVKVTDLSGVFETSVSISEVNTYRFEQAKSSFRRWFENRAVLFVVDLNGPSDNPSFKK
jgi:NB-ARC domain